LGFGERYDPNFYEWFTREISEDINKLFLIPRDHCKSKVGVVSKVVQEIIKNPNNSILIVSKTIDKSKNSLSEIRQHLLSPILVYLFPDIIWRDVEKRAKRGQAIWSSEKIVVRRKVIRADATVWVAGVGKTITGAHPDLVFIDDIINEEDVLTEKRIDKVIKWWEYLQPIISTNSIVRMYGTRYDEFDFYDHIIKQNEKGKVRFKIVVRQVIENGDFIYSYYNVDKLREKQDSMSPYVFRCQYFNEVVAKEEKRFDLELIKDYVTLPESLDNYEWVLTIDPSFSTSKQADNIGYTICGYDGTNNVWIEKAIALKMSIVDLLHRIYRDNETYNFDIVAIEKGAWQNAIKGIFDYIITHEKLKPIPITEIQLGLEINAKANRIIPIADYLQEGVLHFKSDVVDEDTGEIIEKNTADLKSEMYYYSSTSRQKDDVLDSLSMQLKIHVWGNEAPKFERKRGLPKLSYRSLFTFKEQKKTYGYY